MVGIDYRPHDLLWLRDTAALVTHKPLPAWATPAWLAVAPVVVRRAVALDASHVPVGLRGALRSHRFAAELPVHHVLQARTPESIARRVAASSEAARNSDSDLPCLQVLAHLAPALDKLPLAWGVTGSVGFTLASGFDVLRTDSDLDLLVRAPCAADAQALPAVAALLQGLGGHIDIQIETTLGAFALQQWMRGGPVLLKTNRGPVLTSEPWPALR